MLRLILSALLVLSALAADAEQFRKSGTGYYIDKDGDTVRDVDGTEPFVDFDFVYVPSDYSTVQAALDSDDCKRGTTNVPQGCWVRVTRGVYAESFTIGGVVDGATQNSVVVEGIAPGGPETDAGGQTCGVTFIGNNTSNNTVVTVEGSIGWALRNFCIDMDDATTDPQFGLRVGPNGSEPTKHGIIEGLAIEDNLIAGGAAIRVGNGASADIAFNRFDGIRIGNVQTCIVIDSNQAVANTFTSIECANPLATIGGVSVLGTGGELALRDFHFTPGVAGQTGINIRNEALGALDMDHLNFEWDQDNGTFINFENPGSNAGAYRSTSVTNSRFQVQVTATTRHVCIDFNRQGNLLVESNSFESNDAARICEFDFNNPSATKAQDVTWIANDMQWNGAQSDPRVVRSTSGGPMRIAVIDDGDVYSCSGALALNDLRNDPALGCYGLDSSGASTAVTASANDSDNSIATTAFVQQEINGAGGADITCASGVCDADNTLARTANLPAMTVATSAPVDGTTACTEGDIRLDHTANKIYWCVDSATDDWFGAALTDTP